MRDTARTREQRHARVVALRDAGLTGKQIAAELGISYSYVYDLLSDPDGAKAARRKAKARRPCPRCGRLMSGCNGVGPNAPKVCIHCHGVEYGRANLIWTTERLIAAIRSFAAEFGRPPAILDWFPTKARLRGDEARARLAEERFARCEWPWFTTVVDRFGTWNAGIRAAGFEPRPRYGTKETYRRQRKVAA